MFRWFSKKKKGNPPILDFSVLKTDIHSHLIPGLDDGSPNMETTISLIKRMQKLGYKKIITTPHIMSDSYKNSSEDILEGLDKVRKEIVIRNIDIKYS